MASTLCRRHRLPLLLGLVPFVAGVVVGLHLISGDHPEVPWGSVADHPFWVRIQLWAAGSAALSFALALVPRTPLLQRIGWLLLSAVIALVFLRGV